MVSQLIGIIAFLKYEPIDKPTHKTIFIIINPNKYRQSNNFNPSYRRMDQQQLSDLDYDQPQDDLNKDQFKEETLLQYYRYLNLLKRTNNFCKDPNAYKHVTDHDFEDLAIVGWIFQVENLKIKTEDGKEQLNMAPVVYSNIKDPFKNYVDATNKTNNNLFSANNHSARQPSDPSRSQTSLEPHIRRPLLVVKNQYTRYFIKVFNQVIKESKQFKKFFLTPTNNNTQQNPSNNNGNILSEVQWIYAFTGLRVAIHFDKLYFVVTEKTKIIALDPKYYTQTIQNLQKSIGFPYSYLTLNSTPKQFDISTIQDGYPLSNLQTQASIIDKIAFTGILKEKFYDQSPSALGKKDKQVILTFMQDGLNPSKNTLGLAKVLIKCSFDQRPQDIINFFKIGYIYLVTNTSICISDNISILYKPKLKWRQNIFQINLQKSPQISAKIINQLPVVDMSWMKLANVNRNIVKVSVDLIRCEAFYGKLLCTNCKRPINSDKFCTGFCGQTDGQLIIWIVALVSDQSTYAQVSMQKNEAMQFFGFTSEHIQEMRQYILAQNSKKMVRMLDRFNQIQPSNSSQPLMGFQRHMMASFISKKVMGVPRFSLNQSFTHQLSQQEKTEFQQSLQTSKEYMKKNKVHFNGYVKKIDKDLKNAVVFIRVMEVLGQ